MKKTNIEGDYNNILTDTPELNERLYCFAKETDLIYRLKMEEDSLIMYGSSIQKIFQLSYLCSISEQLGIDENSADYNDVSNFKEIISVDYEKTLHQFINNLNKEQEINTSFFLRFSKLVNYPYLKERAENRLKQYIEMHNLHPGIHRHVDVRFCSNDHLEYYSRMK